MTTEFEEKNPDPAAEQARYWVVRLASGEMTGSEWKRFKAWLNTDPRHPVEFKRERAFWQNLESLKDAFQEPEAVRPGSVFPSAFPKVDRAPEPGRRLNGHFALAAHARRTRRIAATGLVAAGLAFFMVWLQFKGFPAGDHWTHAGEQKEVMLPDGSMAHLNTASAINVRYGTGVRRIELLRGEVFVDVKPDSALPFQVAAPSGIVEAVGTSFSVQQKEDGVTVTVSTGEVKVHEPSSQNLSSPVYLKAGEQIDYKAGVAGHSKRTVKLESTLSWREGKIVIDGLPFAEAVKKLERYRRGRVVVLGGPSGAATVSGVFNIQKIDSALIAIASTQGLTVSHMTDYLTVLH